VTRIDALVGVGGVIVLVVLFVVETRAPSDAPGAH